MTKKEEKIKKEKIIKVKKRILKESANLKKNYKTTFKDIKKYFKISILISTKVPATLKIVTDNL